MYAYIKAPDGHFYLSMVFGYCGFKDNKKNCWIVLNAEKTKLIKQYVFNPVNKFIELMVLIVDSDRSNWTQPIDSIGCECVNYLPVNDISDMIDRDAVPNELLEQCISDNLSYTYCEYPEIKTQKDITDLEWATGNLHDAYIAEEKIQENDVLYLRFEGAWGCQVEMWFWGDLKYDTSTRDPQKWDPYWLDSTVLLHDGFVYLADDMKLTVEEIDNGNYCFFKARHMKYHIIPE